MWLMQDFQTGLIQRARGEHVLVPPPHTCHRTPGETALNEAELMTRRGKKCWKMLLGFHAGPSAAQKRGGSVCVVYQCVSLLRSCWHFGGATLWERRTSQAFCLARPDSWNWGAKHESREVQQWPYTQPCRTKGKERQLPGYTKNLQLKMCILIRDIIEDSSEDKYLIKSVASPQQITRNNIWWRHTHYLCN